MPYSVQDNSSALKSSVALPFAANTVNTAGFDLGNATTFPLTTRVGLKVTTGQSTGANTKNITITVQDSADNSSFSAISPGIAIVVAGNAANYPSSSANIALPPNTRRYVRVSAVGEANGGNAGDNNITAQLVF